MDNQLDSNEKIAWLIIRCNQIVSRKQLLEPFKLISGFLLVIMYPILLNALPTNAINNLIIWKTIIDILLYVFLAYFTIKMVIINPYYRKYEKFSQDLEYIQSLSTEEKESILKSD